MRAIFDHLVERGDDVDEIVDYIAGMTDRFALAYADVALGGFGAEVFSQLNEEARANRAVELERLLELGLAFGATARFDQALREA